MDKNSYIILKYINKHSGRILISKLNSKFKNFKNPSLDKILFWLSSNRFIYYNGGEVNDYGDIVNQDIIVLSIAGKQALEEIKSKKHADKFARITAIIAILISICSLIVAIAPYFKE